MHGNTVGFDLRKNATTKQKDALTVVNIFSRYHVENTGKTEEI
jgi:hypothetical protein